MTHEEIISRFVGQLVEIFNEFEEVHVPPDHAVFFSVGQHRVTYGMMRELRTAVLGETKARNCRREP